MRNESEPRRAQEEIKKSVKKTPMRQIFFPRVNFRESLEGRSSNRFGDTTRSSHERISYSARKTINSGAPRRFLSVNLFLSRTKFKLAWTRLISLLFWRQRIERITLILPYLPDSLFSPNVIIRSFFLHLIFLRGFLYHPPRSASYHRHCRYEPDGELPPQAS